MSVGWLWFFFFSSRRRHTRWTGDWSSDVCSSDLLTPRRVGELEHSLCAIHQTDTQSRQRLVDRLYVALGRSEERRVGKSVDLGGRRIIKKKNMKKKKEEGGRKEKREDERQGAAEL